MPKTILSRLTFFAEVPQIRLSDGFGFEVCDSRRCGLGIYRKVSLLEPPATAVVENGEAGTPRPLWNAASQMLMAVGFLLMALAVPGCLYIGSIVVGFCYGVRLAVTVPVASELFGLKCYGLLYNVLILNLPMGSFLFSGLLAGYLYVLQHQEVGIPVWDPIVTVSCLS